MCAFLAMIELTYIIIHLSPSASDDLEDPDKLRSLLKDLREARQAKSRDGLKSLDHVELSVSSTTYPLETRCSKVILLAAFKFVFDGDQRNSSLLCPINGCHDTAG